MQYAKTLSREEMKKITAGEPATPGDGGSVTCKEFHKQTGCYPTISKSDCKGKDGNTYSYASSSGSCD